MADCATIKRKILDDTGIIEHVLRQSDDVVEDQIDSDIEDEPEEVVNCISHTTAMEC